MMSFNFVEPVEPKYSGGEYVVFDTVKSRPDDGLSKGVVLFSKYDTINRKNYCFIQITEREKCIKIVENGEASFKVLKNEWEANPFNIKIYREEDSIKLFDLPKI